MTDRYACPSIDAVWIDSARLARWVSVWAACNRATGHPFDPGTVGMDQLAKDAARLEALYGHDLAAACEALRQQLPPDAARWLHYGLCSSDVTDAGLWLAIQSATDELVWLAREATVALPVLEGDSLYRTHGQAAMVGESAARWSGLAHGLHRATEDLRSVVWSLPPPRFDGPVGTGGVLSLVQRSEISLLLFGRTAPHGHHGRQGISRGPVVAWAQSVASLGTATADVALQIRLLAQSAVHEVTEGHGGAATGHSGTADGYRGSSSMPAKDNPTRCERICGLAPVVRGMVNGYAEAAASNWDAHSLEHSSAERVVLPAATGLVGFLLVELRDIAETLVVHSGDIARNVARAPADGYAERNRLVREGVDGGAAWEQVRAHS